MKIVAKRIDMIASFIEDKKPMPIRFRIQEQEDGVRQTIRVDKIVTVEETKRAGVTAFIYRCQSIIDGIEKQYELRYKVIECKWDLYKI